jgi:hypothetical protein
MRWPLESAKEFNHVTLCKSVTRAKTRRAKTSKVPVNFRRVGRKRIGSAAFRRHGRSRRRVPASSSATLADISFVYCEDDPGRRAARDRNAKLLPRD